MWRFGNTLWDLSPLLALKTTIHCKYFTSAVARRPELFTLSILDSCGSPIWYKLEVFNIITGESDTHVDLDVSYDAFK